MTRGFAACGAALLVLAAPVAALPAATAAPASAAPAAPAGLGGPVVAMPGALAHNVPAPLALPDGATLTLQFIDQALADGRLQAAAELLQRAALRRPSAELKLRAAELMLARGQPTAGPAFQALEAEPTLAARAEAGRGLALLQRGDSDGARQLLQTAVARDPGLVRGWSALAIIAGRTHDWAAAERYHARAIELAPTDARLFNNRGYARLLQRRLPEAEADFRRALQLQPALAVADTNLRLARALAGDYAASLGGSNGRSIGQNLNTVGFGALLRGDLPRAESYFSRALELAPEYRARAAANLDYVQQLKTAGPATDPTAGSAP